uniref:Beta-1,3-N-acetylglucosaminyltransferase lunatic fringe n=1 Tax=Ciona intestinalis TaxID=7719 RepID=L7N0Q9_CIOIN|nr:beta-1,3-N-acetylglucosaminyltransferase lunatic fringe [Ciona intestinalis]|eukprot:XP_002120813.1 beta-1,3-N-acetylglucosaminyltransferase lunatic fringe [Ciona intestinalis]
MSNNLTLVKFGMLCIFTTLLISSHVRYSSICKQEIYRDRKVKSVMDNGKVTLDDIYISVKTSRKFHESRLDPIVKTWFKLAKKQTYFFTDGDDDKLNETTEGHVINTHCGHTKTRPHLSCKMGTEFDTYLASGKKWWCRFDDDNYVNPPRMVHLVNGYNWTQDICIGKLSVPLFATYYHGHIEKYKFAHGGAGCCISRPLALKMKPWCGREKLVVTTRETHMNDDCALGFIITNRLKIYITITDLLHSTREKLKNLNPDTLHEQVSLGQALGNTVNLNKVKSSKIFNHDVDPTRFMTLHCFLFPTADICKT